MVEASLITGLVGLVDASSHYAKGELNTPAAATASGNVVFDTFTGAGSIGSWSLGGDDEHSVLTVTDAGLYSFSAELDWPDGVAANPTIELAVVTSDTWNPGYIGYTELSYNTSQYLQVFGLAYLTAGTGICLNGRGGGVGGGTVPYAYLTLGRIL